MSSHVTHRDRWWVAACALLLVVVNVAIIAPLFFVEYSAYNGSIENTFIAIARVMAEHPTELSWWPYWNGGMPYENAYLPLLQWVVAGLSLVTGHSAARSFHIVTAVFFVLGPLTLFWMALELSRRLAASFFSALAYTCFSLTPLLFYEIRFDDGGWWTLRRLYVLVFWGGAPQVVALAILPVAIVAFHRALTTGSLRWKILAGVLAAAVALSNAFGVVMLVIALICWMVAYRPKPWWRAASTIAAIGILSYSWVSPWMSPSFLNSTRESSMTAGGDFRYTAASWIALAVVISGFLLVTYALQRSRSPEYLRFFVLLAYFPTAFVVTWYWWRIPVIPQPFRYHLEMDPLLLLPIIFVGAALVDRLPKMARVAIVMAVALILVSQTVNSISYARSLIQSVEPSTLSEYKIARWMDQDLPGERAFISGSTTFLYNVFTDNPQVHGGHDQHMVNHLLPVVEYTIYTGTNAGDRDAEYSIFWLKAFGANAITVSGENSTEYYHPFAHPDKFDGVLPLLWRDGDDRIYEVPLRSKSLAHVMPADAIPSRTPIHGLDIESVEPYVAALENAEYPPATFEWKSMSEAEIHSTLEPGQVVSVQITYHPGWEAGIDGVRQPVRGDAIGQLVVEPDCTGACEIALRFTGGTERTLTRVLSASAMLITLGLVLFSRRRSRQSPAAVPPRS